MRKIVFRILLLALGILAIGQSKSVHSADSVVVHPLYCDSGLSRHSFHQAALTAESSENEAPTKDSSNSKGMLWISGGRFWMGTDLMPDAKPVHQVEVNGFWMDQTDVTNEEFAKFVAATGYVTIAERPLDPKEFPNASPEDLAAGSVVFSPPDHAVSLENPLAWWKFVKGANWRHPEGPKSNLQGKEKFPVVQVAWADAAAYAKWAGKRLPTEAEWEFASRGGLDRKKYTWGDELRPNGKWMANTFQGNFPERDNGADGHRGIARVASYPANRYGLYDMSGNVWEWVSDWYRADYYVSLGSEDAIIKNPGGPADSFDPLEPGISKRVQKGGSFLCTDQYCERYIAGARGKGDPETASNHVGFRCVK